MNTGFQIIVETGKGRAVYSAADLAEAIEIYCEQLNTYPDNQIHLLRDMPEVTPTVTISGEALVRAFEHKKEKPGPKIVKHGKIDRQYKQQLDGVGDPDCPLYDKHIRITGTFDQIDMSRDDVAAACQRLGAKQVSEGLAKSMDIVIMGNNAGPSKMEKIKLWQAEGYKITVLSQFDIKKIFDEYIPSLP